MTVGFTSSLLIVPLVILFADVEWLSWEQQSIDLITLVAQDLDDMLSYGALLLISIEEATTILWPQIRTYTICLGRIMNLEEDLAELLVARLGRIILYDDRLYVMCPVVAYIGIGREGLFATGIACQSTEYPWFLVILMLCAPETTAGEDADFDPLVFGILIQIHLRTDFDSLLHHLQGAAMLLLKLRVILASGEVVLEIVVLDLKGDRIARVDDVLHIVEVVGFLLVREKSQGTHDTFGNALRQDIFECDIGILHYVM